MATESTSVGRSGISADAEGAWTGVNASHVLSPAEKRSALEEVVQSTAFVRGEQLRSFLRYVCEMEIAHRSGELSEYVIGVEALGRPPGYSTSEDSSVRRRAHDLRHKLEEVYATELKGARIRIDIPKGSYVPRFLVAPAATVPEDIAVKPVELSEPPARTRIAPRPWPFKAAWLAAGFAGGALAASAGLLSSRAAPTAVDAVLLEAWHAVARPGTSLLICLSAPAQYQILPYPRGPLPPKVSLLPPSTDLREWYDERYPMQPDDRLASQLTDGSVRVGDALGLVTAIKTLDRLGVDFQVVTERSVSPPTVVGRNLLLFGNPEYSFVAASLLEQAFWTVGYDPARAVRVIRPSKESAPAESVYAPRRNAEGRLTEAFGLITVVPSDRSGRTPASKAVIISCTDSAGCQAAMEFFSSGSSMSALREQFRRENHAGFPEAYQVVVRCRVHGAPAVFSEYEYESHVTLPISHVSLPVSADAAD